jgi:hypothetical protein
MSQRPNAVPLILCKDVIIEEGTRSLTLVKTFRRLHVGSVPSSP